MPDQNDQPIRAASFPDMTLGDFIAFRGPHHDVKLILEFFAWLKHIKETVGKESGGVVRNPRQFSASSEWLAFINDRVLTNLDGAEVWAPEDIIDCLLTGEYQLLNLEISEEGGILHYYPLAYPFGGTDPLKAFVQLYGYTVTRDSFWDGYHEHLARSTKNASSSNIPARLFSLLEVLAAFITVHVTYRTLMFYSPLGELDRNAGTNFIPGTVMALFTIILLVLCRRRFCDYGLVFTRREVRWLTVALLGLLLLPVAITAALGQLSSLVVLRALWVILGAGVGEEIFFRGYIQSRLNAAFGFPWNIRGVCFGFGTFVASLLFGFLHVLNSVDYFHGRFDFAWHLGLVTLASGLLFAFLREATGNIAAGVVVHGALDIFSLLLKIVAGR